MKELFESKPPEYPWQIDLSEWSPQAGMTEAERRADEARFHFWKGLLDKGHFNHPQLFYDEGPGFFRFSNGTFAPSHTHAN